MSRGTVNKVFIIGRLGADPDLRYTPNGNAVATLSVATNEVWKDRDGNMQERTEWHRVVLWGRQAEVANEYLKKGSRVFIEGRLQTRNWEDKDGIKRYTTEIISQNIQFLDTRSDADAGMPPIPPISDDDLPEPIQDNDDLPF